MKLLALLLPLSMLFAVLACSGPTENENLTDNKGLTNRGKKANMDKAATHDLISVEIGTLRQQVQVNEQHLHGRFFHDRAEFYVVENPELYISNTEVKELTLYFIDGTLCKKKYQLAEDISSELIRSYGGFKFRPLNHRTRALAKSESVVKKSEDGTTMNEKLDKFQMKWDDREVTIKYRLQRDSIQSSIFLEEELPEYKHVLAMAERDISL